MRKPSYDCNLCNMRFDDLTSYQNHKSNYCAGTNFKLDATNISKIRAPAQEQSTMLNASIADQIQQNEDEYKVLRNRALERSAISQHNLSNHNYSTLIAGDSMSQLQEQMNATVRTALFGQDTERELILKELRDRAQKESEYAKDKDTIQREMKKPINQNRQQELRQLGADRDLVYEKYCNFIQQCNEILKSKSGLYKKDTTERVIQLSKIKESIENERTRIMTHVFGDLNQSQINKSTISNRKNDASRIAAQQILEPAHPYNELAQQWQLPELDPQQIQQEMETIDRNREQARKLGQEIKMHMVGMDPALGKYVESNGLHGVESIFSEKMEDYQSMSPEQKKLIAMIAQETDAKRAAQRLPPGPMQQQAYQQIADIVRMRNELERTVQEQKYAKIRENYSLTNKDPDEERRLAIRNRLVHTMEEWRGERKYKPFEGLVIHWDWVLNLPNKFERCRVTWGIFLRGQVLHRPTIVNDRICVSDGYRVNYCMFADRNFVYDLVPNKDMILVIELQCYLHEGGRKKLEIYGWTVLELFDLNMNLVRGRFKLPFYPTGTNPSQLVSSDQPLKSVSNTLLYCRISFPFDHEYGKDEPLDPLQMTSEYYLTGIHSKTIIQHDYDHVKQPLRLKEYNPLAFDELFNRKAIPEAPGEEEIIEEPEYQLRELGNKRKGIYINVHEILNYFVRTKSKVRVFLTDVKRGVIKDEKEVPCSFETDPYEMIDNIKTTNILNGPFVFIEEEYQFFVDLDTYAHNNKAWDDLYLIFQVFDEVPPPEPDVVNDEAKDDDIISVKSEPPKQKGSKWYCFKLYENNTMKIGRYAEYIFDPPIKKPPVDPLECKMTQSQIDFSINFFDYDMNYLDDQMDRFRQLRALKKRQRQGPPKEKKKKEKKPEKLAAYDWEKLPISDRPYIENLKILYQDRAFEKGFGIDFYVDQARFLPDNVTICKIIIQFMNTNLEKLFPPKSVLPDIKTGTYSPVFNFKQELRSPHFDPTMLAFLTILTIDNTNKEVRIAGYCAINLFLLKSSKIQPTNPLERDVILMNGLYQLPIFCQHPTLIKPFNMTRVQKLDRLPCSTLLVRIFMAPMSDDGFKPLGINDFSQKDWEAKKVWQRMPPYGTGLYNTQFCPIRETEKLLYNIRVLRTDPQQVEIIQRLMAFYNVGREMSQAETLGWLDQKLVRDAYTDIIELTYFAKYKGQVGFKISVDGFHNVPNTDHPYVALYSLNPPGKLYFGEEYDKRDIITCTSYNWDSALGSPQFNEAYFKFKDIPFDKNTHIIIDIRRVVISQRGNKQIVEKIGWTLLPIFTQNQFVKSGVYQLPVFQGAVPVEFIKELQTGDIWDQVNAKLAIKQGGLKYLSPMSVIVRLLDGHREGHFQIPFDHSRMIYQFLPQNKLSSYVYNSGVHDKLKNAKKLISIAPNKEQLNEYNEKIARVFFDSINIKFDDNAIKFDQDANRVQAPGPDDIL